MTTHEPNLARAAADAESASGASAPDEMRTCDLSIIMPVYNEASNLPAVLQEAIETARSADFACEILVVDDASTDNSLAVLREFESRHSDLVRVLTHKKNQGIAKAFRTLDANARGRYVFLIGSDGQWRMAECLRMMAARVEREVIVGRRRRKQYKPLRTLISWAYNALPVVLFGVRTYDAGSIKLYPAELARMKLISRGVFDEAERLIRARKRGYSIRAIDVEHLGRKAGKASGARWSLVFEAVGDLCRCWWDIMIRKNY